LFFRYLSPIQPAHKMTPNQITSQLSNNTEELKQFIQSQDANFWEYKPSPEKWTAGQHVIHLVQSSAPLSTALRIPDFLLKWRFGKSNRPSRMYEDVVKRYQEKLSAAGPGVVGPFSRNMPESSAQEQQLWFEKLEKINQKINKETSKLSDKQLDTILLSHPLMGRMTLREILMWNTYHTEHHLSVLRNKYIKF
jgi:hypothetical protein